MTIEISKAALLADLNLVKPAVSSQAFVPSLTHFLFTGTGVVGYNDLSAIEVKSDVDMCCCVPADLLIKTLNSLSSDKVAITEDAGQITLKSGNAKVKIPTLPQSDFPFSFPYGEDEAGYELNDDILEGIEKCLAGVGTDPTHPAQMGVTIYPGEVATIYSTDNYTMSKFETETELEFPGDSPVILPTFFCTQLLALAKAFKSEVVSLYVPEGAVVASFGDQAFLYTKMLVALEPLDFPKIFKKHVNPNMIDFHELPAGLDEAVARAEIVMASDLDKIVQLKISRSTLHVSASSALGESYDTFKLSAPDAEMFSVDPVLLSRALKSSRKMGLSENALVLSNSSYIHLIAHVRSK